MTLLVAKLELWDDDLHPGVVKDLGAVQIRNLSLKGNEAPPETSDYQAVVLRRLGHMGDQNELARVMLRGVKRQGTTPLDLLWRALEQHIGVPRRARRDAAEAAKSRALGALVAAAIETCKRYPEQAEEGGILHSIQRAMSELAKTHAEVKDAG